MDPYTDQDWENAAYIFDNDPMESEDGPDPGCLLETAVDVVILADNDVVLVEAKLAPAEPHGRAMEAGLKAWLRAQV